MRLLVTGGAGYIGSHAVERLCDEGHHVVVIDNLMSGHRQAVDQRAAFEEFDLKDQPEVERVLRDHGVEAVFHFAALSIVGDSMSQPLRYWDNNVSGAISLLAAMDKCGVEQLIFSSTCSTYGEPKQMPISEGAPQLPINTYGQTKLAIERMIADYGCGNRSFRYGLLRYFNVAGCGIKGRLGEDHRPETHLLPIIIETALGQRPSVSIYGTDYDTPDGTCLRDYLHVDDLVDAHVKALAALPETPHLVVNLGAGRALSVRELIDAVQRVTGVDFPVIEAPRRAGDVPVLCCDTSYAKAVLGWQPIHSDLEHLVQSAWRWRQRHPFGYDDSVS